MTARTIALHRQNPAEARGAGRGKELSGANQFGPLRPLLTFPSRQMASSNCAILLLVACSAAGEVNQPVQQRQRKAGELGAITTRPKSLVLGVVELRCYA